MRSITTVLILAIAATQASHADPLRDASHEVENIANELRGLESEIGRLSGQLEKVNGEIAALRQIPAKAQDAANAADKAKKMLLNTPIRIGFSVNIRADYDFKTNGLGAYAEFPEGFGLKSVDVDALLRGQMAFPDVDASRLLASSLSCQVDKSCDYQDQAEKFYARASLEDRIYVSSRSLSEAISTDNGLSAGLKAIVTGGSSAKTDLEQVSRVCLDELESVNAFLQDVGKGAPLPTLAQLVCNPTSFTMPDVEVKSFQAKSISHIRMPIGLDILQQDAVKAGFMNHGVSINSQGVTVEQPRFGFAVIVHHAGNVPVPNFKGLGQFRKLSPSEISTLLQNGLPSQLLPALQKPSFSGMVLAGARDEMMKLNYGALTRLPNREWLVDLRSTPVASKIANLCSGKLTIKKLEQNLQSGKLYLEADIKVTGSITLEYAIRKLGRGLSDVVEKFSEIWRQATSTAGLYEKKLREMPGKLSSAVDRQKNLSKALDAAKNAKKQAEKGLSYAKDRVKSIGQAVHKLLPKNTVPAFAHVRDGQVLCKDETFGWEICKWKFSHTNKVGTLSLYGRGTGELRYGQNDILSVDYSIGFERTMEGPVVTILITPVKGAPIRGYLYNSNEFKNLHIIGSDFRADRINVIQKQVYHEPLGPFDFKKGSTKP